MNRILGAVAVLVLVGAVIGFAVFVAGEQQEYLGLLRKDKAAQKRYFALVDSNNARENRDQIRIYDTMRGVDTTITVGRNNKDGPFVSVCWRAECPYCGSPLVKLLIEERSQTGAAMFLPDSTLSALPGVLYSGKLCGDCSYGAAFECANGHKFTANLERCR